MSTDSITDPHVDLDFSLAGKTAVVTGGASGIGAAIASAFALKGARVAILDLSLDAAVERAPNSGTLMQRSLATSAPRRRSPRQSTGSATTSAASTSSSTPPE